MLSLLFSQTQVSFVYWKYSDSNTTHIPLNLNVYRYSHAKSLMATTVASLVAGLPAQVVEAEYQLHTLREALTEKARDASVNQQPPWGQKSRSKDACNIGVIKSLVSDDDDDADDDDDDEDDDDDDDDDHDDVPIHSL